MQTDSLPLKIYLDTCCLSRLSDPPSQVKLIAEIKAIRQIMFHILRSQWRWISSTVLVDEVEQNPDLEKRIQAQTWVSLAHQSISVGASEISKGKQLEALGFKEYDALHIACAESGKVDIFLTTDDRLIRKAKRFQAQLYIQVDNPVTWLKEVTGNGHFKDDRS